MKKEEIKKMIEEIFDLTGCSLDDCSFEEENGMLWCSIETPDSRFLIGKEGKTLKSFNHLFYKMTEGNFQEGDPSLFIDINGYQKKRFDNLKNIAYMMAERARYFKSNIEVDPMPAYERRIIHLFLEGAKDVKTESTGTGPDRRVVIKYNSDSI
ncbi:MAG: R3H domain-containing nucleic acid-binding protein [Patescibacteria group bacterium]|nr:R3H domain-containing nucleic acid-binding protein [Patescibacteria group bacterium]